MPCNSRAIPRQGETQAEADLRQQVDELTGMLCAVCRLAMDSGRPDLLDVEGVLGWWHLHEELDRDNLREETKSDFDVEL